MELNEKIKEYILSKSVLRSERRIGIEVECFIYKKNYSRLPVNRSKEYSAIDLLNELNKINKDSNGTYSLEPGGQIELSGAELSNIHQTCTETTRHLKELKEIGNIFNFILLEHITWSY